MDKAIIFYKVGIFFQYFLLILLYLFLWKVLCYARASFLATAKGRKDAMVSSQKIWDIAVENSGVVVGIEHRHYRLCDNFFIGRGHNNSLSLKDTAVSHEHACFNIIADKVILTDLASTNGIFVNGLRVQDSACLEIGDKVQIGSVHFVLIEGGR